jgi:hypothetical protein
MTKQTAFVSFRIKPSLKRAIDKMAKALAAHLRARKVAERLDRQPRLPISAH